MLWCQSANLVIPSTVALVFLWAPADAAEERPLSKTELIELFEGKSWMWSDGAGYFAPKGRFLAKSGTGAKRTSVDGEWTAADNGRVCFSGTWVARSSRKYNRTCFLHKVKDGHIYQRRLPAGEWYIFKHSQPQDGDQKLFAGDARDSKAPRP